MHPFVVKETFVVYGWARLVGAAQLEAIVDKDISKRHHKSCSLELLGRLRTGLLASPFTEDEVLEFCRLAFMADNRAESQTS
jgi:hypothetical protein